MATAVRSLSPAGRPLARPGGRTQVEGSGKRAWNREEATTETTTTNDRKDKQAGREGQALLLPTRPRLCVCVCLCVCVSARPERVHERQHMVMSEREGDRANDRTSRRAASYWHWNRCCCCCLVLSCPFFLLFLVLRSNTRRRCYARRSGIKVQRCVPATTTTTPLAQRQRRGRGTPRRMRMRIRMRVRGRISADMPTATITPNGAAFNSRQCVRGTDCRA